MYSCVSAHFCRNPVLPFWEPRDIYQTVEAIRTLVPLARGAMGGSAIIRPVSRPPPKQKSMELNQQASGLERDTWRTPGQGQDAETAR